MQVLALVSLAVNEHSHCLHLSVWFKVYGALCWQMGEFVKQQALLLVRGGGQILSRTVFNQKIQFCQKLEHVVWTWQ